LNILFSIHLYPPQHLCGAEFVAHSIAKHFQKKGDTIKVLLHQANHYKIESHYVYDGVDVIPPDSGLIMNLFYWADVVFTHLDYTKWTIHMAAMHKKPVFHLIHNTQPRPPIIDAEKPQYIIYNSESSRKLLGYKHDSFVLLPPVDYRDYEGEKGDAITLINLNENKGADIFFRLAEIMPERRFIGVKGSYDYQLTGKILDEEKKAVNSAEGFIKVINKVDKTPKNVELWGKQQDIREVYKQTRILLMPSRYESFGRTATEAMSSGIPVICTATFGLVENCGRAGIYIQNRDNLDEWIEAINKLDRKAEYDKASKKAKERAKEQDPGESLDRLWEWVREKRNSYR
jgi:glycosyltransferase involved in cell wall biosynthesis